MRAGVRMGVYGCVCVWDIERNMVRIAKKDLMLREGRERTGLLKIEKRIVYKHTCSVIIVDTCSSDKRIQWTGEGRGNGCKIIRGRGDREFFSLMLTFRVTVSIEF